MALDSLDANLLQSARKPKNDPAATPAAANSELRRKKILKGCAYAVFFFWSLLFFTCLKIPDAAVANFLLNSLNQNTPYQWQADSIRMGFFPWIHLRADKLAMEPKFPGGGLPLYFDELRLYPNPLTLPAVGGNFSAEAYKASVHGSFSSGSTTSVRLETGYLDLARLTPLTQTGVDLKGIVTNLFLKLAIPGQRLAQADGEINLQGKNVVFDPSTLQLGMPLPILNLGDVNVEASVNKGVVKFEKFKVGSAGKDLEIQITSGTITLADVMPNTRYDLHLTLKPSPAILTVVPGLGAMLDSMATKRPDGFYALKLQGSLSAPGFPMRD